MTCNKNSIANLIITYFIFIYFAIYYNMNDYNMNDFYDIHIFKKESNLNRALI